MVVRGWQALTRHPLIVLASLALVVALGRIVLHDPGELHVRGDEAAFVYDALSLQGGDLSFDAEDHQRWVELDWDQQAHGLFVQRRAEGWAFAKPYGYSVLLAGPLALFGLRAVSYVGALLVLAYAGCWYAAARLRWDRTTAAVVAAAATVASHAWFYGFPAHADLFVAVLVGVVVVGGLRARWRHEVVSLVVAAAAAGLLVTEKVPAFLALLPFLATAGWRVSATAKALAVATVLAVAGVSMVPYLHYSDGESWSAYGGERYYAPGRTPWSGGTEAELRRMITDEVITLDYVVDRVTSPSADLPAATVTYVVGRNTGVLTFLPIVPALLVATALAARRRRGLSTPDPPEAVDVVDDDIDRPMVWAAAVSLASYVAFYLVLFTDNYFGGAQSIGSRYFLQVSVLSVAIPLAGGLPRAAARWCAAFAAAWALVVLGPNLVHADRAFHDLGHHSTLQRLLPRETTQLQDLFADDEADDGSGGEGP